MSHTPQQLYRLQKEGLAWLVAYLLLVAGVVWLVYHYRARVMLELDTPEAREDWGKWRAAEKENAETGPVRRRVPASLEPPMLVLLRDHFSLVLGAAVFFSSVLFGLSMFLVRGAWAKPSQRGSPAMPDETFGSASPPPGPGS